jgi:hypothetical protein
MALSLIFIEAVSIISANLITTKTENEGINEHELAMNQSMCVVSRTD